MEYGLSTSDLSFKTKDYVSGTLRLDVEGYLTDEGYGYEKIHEKRPIGTVIIPGTIRFYPYLVPSEPCGCCGQPQPSKWYTTILVKAFPDVAPDHEHSVRILGQRNRIVRLPVITPLEAAKYI